MLTKEQILAAACLKTKTVEIPELNGEIIIRTMSGHDRDAYTDLVRDRDAGSSYFAACLVVTCAVDAQGNKLFDAGDIDALRALSGPMLTNLANEIAEHCGFTATA
ncbi:hypothetical protein WCQ02_18000 [Paraburkholderia tropica]|uniref:hypothetical protein n=1 Tax=Paraburkholderia tropica TaxID=92647 RepID=UPI0030181C27